MEPACAAQPRSGLRILVADDNPDTVEMMALVLRLHGHEVQTAPDGLTALRLFQEQKPDVVFLDIGMPHMSGWDVARRVRELVAPACRPPLLVAITGYGGAENEQRSAEAGFDRHLLKPVDIKEIQRLLYKFSALMTAEINGQAS